MMVLVAVMVDGCMTRVILHMVIILAAVVVAAVVSETHNKAVESMEGMCLFHCLESLSMVKIANFKFKPIDCIDWAAEAVAVAAVVLNHYQIQIYKHNRPC